MLLIPCFWVCCLGLLHESQNESILAERAFLEARRQLTAKEAKERTQREEEKKEREKDKEEEEEVATPARQSRTVEQGEMQREEQQKSVPPLHLNVTVGLVLSRHLRGNQAADIQWWLRQSTLGVRPQVFLISSSPLFLFTCNVNLFRSIRTENLTYT